LPNITAFAGARKTTARVESESVKVWKIYLVGTMRVIAPGGEDILALPRKTRGLLAYLCLAQPRRVSRSRLMALLWDGFEDRARRNLRDALYMLERLVRAKSAGLILLDHQYVALNAERCWIDVLAEPDYQFERLLEDLDGISPSFDHWLSGERSRVEDRIRNALDAEITRLTEEKAPADQRAVAARKLVNFDRTHEGAVRALMGALADMGDHPQALREYQRCRAALRDSLDTSPSRETTALCEAIRLASPRNAANIRSPPTASLTTLNPNGGAPDRPSKPSIAVLPFRNLSGEQRHDYTADGLVEDVIGVLSRIPGFFVISRLSTLTFRRQDRLPQDIGELLDVRYILSGSMRLAHDRLYLIAELTDAVKGTVLWSSPIEERFSNLIDVQIGLAEEIVRQVGPQLRAAELQRARAKRPEQLNAYDFFLRAQEDMHNSSPAVFNGAERLFDEAIRRYPGYATALAWRAYWHVLRVGQGWSLNPEHDAALAAEFARRAIDCDPFEPMAYAVQGHIDSYLHKDFEMAFRRFETAVRLNPNAAPAWLFSGAARAWIGDGPRAVEEVSKAIALSPYDPLIYASNSAASAAHLAAGQNERAVEFAWRAVKENKTYTAAYKHLIIALVLAGRGDEARPPVQQLLRLEPGFTVERYRQRNPGIASRNGNLCCEALAVAGIPLRD
jgi:TolB-like protein